MVLQINKYFGKLTQKKILSISIRKSQEKSNKKEIDYVINASPRQPAVDNNPSTHNILLILSVQKR